jgi:hypothetical protein
MEKIVLYCKSFHRDVDRVVNLWESIQKYNKDNISFYVSVPKQDIELFKSKGIINLIEDESIYNGQSLGWVQQQIVKSNFWKLNISENYVCIDSDGYFIKDFYITDFMYDDKTPYTVIHEQKELFTWTVSNIIDLGFDPKLSYIKDRQKIMDLFGRKGKYYDFGPVPTIWSSKVWKSLEDNYITPNNITWEQMLEYSPSEFSWYGESLLAFEKIKIYPVEPIFKVFHYAKQLTEYMNKEITQEMISQNYLGIIIQSNFNAKIKY